MAAQDRVEISRFAHPDVLLAGIARYIAEPVLLKYIINEAGAIHAASCRLCRAIGVIEILLCQLETVFDDLADFRRIVVIFFNLVRRNGSVRRTFFFEGRMHGWQRC